MFFQNWPIKTHMRIFNGYWKLIQFLAIYLACTHVFALTISHEVEVSKSSEFIFNSTDDYVLDGTLSIIGDRGGYKWISPFWDRKRGGIVHLLTKGALEGPMESRVWMKDRSALFENVKPKEGNLWIANTYIDKAGILAFVHVEAVEGSGHPGSSGKTRIGIAWSENSGETFKYLGGVIAAYGDPNPHNVQGGIYIIRDGYFYVYFHDIKGITVARASVEEVVVAAKNGKTSSWKKYMGDEIGFAAFGLGGDSYPIGVMGASHNDAACSTYNNRCYLVLTTMTWGGKNSTIKLFESADGIHWNTVKVIAEIPPTSGVRGYQYAAIVSDDNSENATVGRKFYIYSALNHLDVNRKLVRWTVDLGN